MAELLNDSMKSKGKGKNFFARMDGAIKAKVKGVLLNRLRLLLVTISRFSLNRSRLRTFYLRTRLNDYLLSTIY